ncbi:hypothetical protein [Salinibius halmophilus]|uniref:hypothetical protein n=1 Tax=Salinibius halmophilus TaxID=1853216 RepID=UPI000E670C48|nr:hypothetical protein [Salinibius halmophilus]
MRQFWLAVMLPVALVGCSNEQSGNLATSEIGMNAEVQVLTDGSSRSAVATVQLFEGKAPEPTGPGASLGYTRPVELTDGDSLFVQQGTRKAWLLETEVDGDVAYSGSLSGIDPYSPIYVQLRRNNQQVDAFDSWITVPADFQLIPNSVYSGRLNQDIELHWSQVSSSDVRYHYQLTCHFVDNFGTWQQETLDYVSAPESNTRTTVVSLPNLEFFDYCNGHVGVTVEVTGQADSNLYRTSSISAVISKSRPVVLTP